MKGKKSISFGLALNLIMQNLKRWTLNFNQYFHYFLLSAFKEDTVCVGLARVGSENQTIIAATFKEMTTVDIGGPLHSFIIPGELHPLEKDMLKLFAFSDNVKTLLNS